MKRLVEELILDTDRVMIVIIEEVEVVLVVGLSSEVEWVIDSIP